MTKVLFLCVHNSARSQIAEAYLKKLGGYEFEVESAGLEPGKLNALVIEVLKEEGIDISNNNSDDVFDFFKQGKLFSYVITVCDVVNAQRCPIFPGMQKRIAWDFEDPSSFTGSHQEKLAKTRVLRDQIKQAVQDFIIEIENKDEKIS